MSENDINEPRRDQPAPPSPETPAAGGSDAGWRPSPSPSPSPSPDAGWPAGSDDTTVTSPSSASPSSTSPSSGSPSFDSTSTTGPYAYPTAGYPAASYPAGGYQTAGYPTAYPAASGYPGAANYQTAAYPAPSVATIPSRRRGRAGRFIGIGLVMIALMLGSGVAGAALVDHDSHTTTTRIVGGTVVDNAPIIDRSSLASIAAAVRPSVVSIDTGTAEGSGVILSSDGYVLTNNHVAVTAQGQKVNITFDNGDTVKGALVGTDAKTDLAVFKADSLPGKLTVAKFGNSDALQVGDTVLAIGSPLGLDGSVTEGIVSALNRTIDESSDSQPQNPFGQNSQNQAGVEIAGAIQTDAAINPGNSGGALVNMNGEVVGINTAIATGSNGSDGNIGVGFAIPSNRAKTVADDLIKGVKVSHPYLGIGVVTADGNGGALVRSVTAGSPAASAGLQINDVITAINGKTIHTSEDLINAVQAGRVGDTVQLSVTRGSSNTTVNATLGEAK
jgi:putative serine protease PepD